MKEPKYVIVIGASAGGLHTLVELMAQVTEEMDAAVLVVLHTPHTAFGDILVEKLQKNSVFTCKMAEHEEHIRSRHLYLAVPDHHLLVKEGKMFLGRGPVENRWRPSIDVLFRSAAVSYNSRTIGVVLTGLLEDGTTGMQCIKECGGTCIVQDPKEAEYPDMPASVLLRVEVDYCTSLQRIAIILQEKVRDGAPVPHEVPPTLLKEAQIAERISIGIEKIESLDSVRSPYSCPDCGGALFEIKQGGITRFRCYTGHMYNSDDLLESKRKELENAFWVALRILEERRNLLYKMSEEESTRGWAKSAANKVERARELDGHISRIKEVLFYSTDDPEPTRLELEGK
jgi:two-component system chemotaxis response regulator CheB